MHPGARTQPAGRRFKDDSEWLGADTLAAPVNVEALRRDGLFILQRDIEPGHSRNLDAVNTNLIDDATACVLVEHLSDRLRLAGLEDRCRHATAPFVALNVLRITRCAPAFRSVYLLAVRCCACWTAWQCAPACTQRARTWPRGRPSRPPLDMASRLRVAQSSQQGNVAGVEALVCDRCGRAPKALRTERT